MTLFKVFVEAFLKGFGWTSGVTVALALVLFLTLSSQPWLAQHLKPTTIEKTLYSLPSKVSDAVPIAATKKEIVPLPRAEYFPPADKPDLSKVDHVTVSKARYLIKAIDRANKGIGPTTIVLKPGSYLLRKTLSIKADNVRLLSLSGNPEDTIINGKGMTPSSRVENLFRVRGKNFMLDGITLQRAGNHLIQIAGEADADGPILRNCVLRDSYEQLLKVSWNKRTRVAASDNGLIENCLFEYSKGIGPNYYIGGIDVHAGHNWVVRNNVFKNIASPGKHVAEHAIHFWNYSDNTLIEKNVIINSDRGIGFGMKGRINFNGIIRDNLILHADNGHPFADVGIILEQSPGTKVYNNRIFLAHGYDSSIEYRFSETSGVEIYGNTVNKPVKKRNGASGKVSENKLVDSPSELLSEEELTDWGHLFSSR